ncbi:hypothetical protein B0H34DRAFT_675421 [Crassisporium funariophilum]|nr:hypothetical protein B0H34DRAFT_675421 [Crassisporium funariophilum]
MSAVPAMPAPKPRAHTDHRTETEGSKTEEDRRTNAPALHATPVQRPTYMHPTRQRSTLSFFQQSMLTFTFTLRSTHPNPFPYRDIPPYPHPYKPPSSHPCNSTSLPPQTQEGQTHGPDPPDLGWDSANSNPNSNSRLMMGWVRIPHPTSPSFVLLREYDPRLVCEHRGSVVGGLEAEGALRPPYLWYQGIAGYCVGRDAMLIEVDDVASQGRKLSPPSPRAKVS